MFGTFSPLVRWVAGALLAILVIFSIYYKGRLDEREIFNRYKAEVKAAAMAQNEKARQVEEKNAKLLKETRDAYNTKLASLRSYYGLRVNNQGGSGLSKVSGSPNGTDGYSPDNLPSTAVLAGQCAETTLNLLALQNWVKDVYNNQ